MAWLDRAAFILDARMAASGRKQTVAQSEVRWRLLTQEKPLQDE